MRILSRVKKLMSVIAIQQNATFHHLHFFLQGKSLSNRKVELELFASLFFPKKISFWGTFSWEFLLHFSSFSSNSFCLLVHFLFENDKSAKKRRGFSNNSYRLTNKFRLSSEFSFFMSLGLLKQIKERHQISITSVLECLMFLKLLCSRVFC